MYRQTEDPVAIEKGPNYRCKCPYPPAGWIGGIPLAVDGCTAHIARRAAQRFSLAHGGIVTATQNGADVTPPLRNAQPTVPDVRA